MLPENLVETVLTMQKDIPFLPDKIVLEITKTRITR